MLEEINSVWKKDEHLLMWTSDNKKQNNIDFKHRKLKKNTKNKPVFSEDVICYIVNDKKL